jgi:hypothetical protein
MLSITRATVVLGCATALMLLPGLAGSQGSFLDRIGYSAYAKEGGGGNGGGNGGGHGAGQGGGEGRGHGGANAGGRGGANKSEFATERSDRGTGGARGGGKGVAGFLGDLFGAGHGKGKTATARSDAATAASRNAGSADGKGPLAKQQEAALKGKAVPIPSLKELGREKNLHARLGGLNSLNRNYQAYLNARDPKFAAVQAYVLAAANSELTAAALAEAAAALELAREEFDALVSAIEPHDDFSYATDLTAADLEARLAELQAIDPTELDSDAAAALEGEIEALAAALESPEFGALTETQQAVADLEATLAEQEAATTDEALQEALQLGANPNREVDEEMVDWAKDVLGVGDTYGKIDQVREALQSEAAEAEIVVE